MNVARRTSMTSCLLATSGLFIGLQAAAAQPGSMDYRTDKMMVLAFSPDGRYLAGGGLEKKVRVWDLHQSGWIRILEESAARTLSVSFSPDSKTLAAGFIQGEVHLWEMETGKLKAVLGGHKEWVRSVAFAPDGKTLATASHEYKGDFEQRRFAREVKLWDPDTGLLKQTLNQEEGLIADLAFSPDGITLAAAINKGGAEKSFIGIRLWDLKTGKVVKALPIEEEGVPISVAFSPDGKQLVCGGGYCRRLDGSGGRITGQAWVWELSTSRLLRTFAEPGDQYYRTIAFFPDGKMLATGCEGPSVEEPGGKTYSLSGQVNLWNLATGKLAWKKHCDYRGVEAIAVSPDGKTIAACGGKRVQLLDAKTGTTRQVLMEVTYR